MLGTKEPSAGDHLVNKRLPSQLAVMDIYLILSSLLRYQYLAGLSEVTPLAAPGASYLAKFVN